MALTSVTHPTRRALLGTLGVCVYMLILALLDILTKRRLQLPALVPPFGASAVIVFFTPESPFGRPRNVLLGHFVSALAASVVLWSLPQVDVGVLAALAVSASGVLMLATRSFHPPGGATALLAVVAERRLGFEMALCPMLIGAVVLVVTRFVLDRSIVWWTPAVTAQERA